MNDDIPQTPIQPARRSLLDRVSIVWVIPLGALLIALGIAWQAYLDRGALIEISFRNAAGIVADQTTLRYRNVEVGVVESVGFSDDLGHVVAEVRLDKEVEPFVDAESTFWIVQPEVSARGISGLETVLSGVYIEGSWDEVPEGLHRSFVGFDDTPLVRGGENGAKFTLRSTTGKGLSEGTPILYKGLEVGRVGAPRLAQDGVTIEADAVVLAPHDNLMTTQSRFWDTSGISFSLGAGGAAVDFESLSSLISGGVSFETVVSGGTPVADGTMFTVYADQDEARASLFDGAEGGRTIQMAVVFEENVTGLAVGAPVTLRGLEIGEVVSLSGKVDAEQFGDERVRLIVVLSIGLEHLQLGERTEEDDILDFFAEAVEQNWRARLTRASLLSGGLKIEFVEVPDAAPAVFERDASPYPIMPSVTAEIPAVSASAEGLLKRVNDLPVEELLQSAISFMEGASQLVASDEIQQIPADVRDAISDIRTLIGSADLQAVPAELGAVLEGIEAAVEEVSGLFTDLNESEGAKRLVEAVEAASDAASSISETADLVPELVERIAAVAAKAESLDLETLLDEAKDLVGGAGDILGTEAARALPETLTEALSGVDAAVGEATALMSEFNEADAGAKLAEAIESAGNAAAGIEEATAGLPGLIDQIRAVADKAEAMDLDQLVEEVTGLVTSFEAMIGTEAARALPESFGTALDELSTALNELRAGGTVANVNATLDSARVAAQSVAAASNDLPGLVRRTETVLVEAEAALAALSDAGGLNREARAALSEISRAAQSVRSLARTLERKPNALLTGK